MLIASTSLRKLAHLIPLFSSCPRSLSPRRRGPGVQGPTSGCEPGLPGSRGQRYAGAMWHRHTPIYTAEVLGRFGMGRGGVRLRRWGLCIRRVRSSISPHQFAKSFAAPRQTRTHRADRHTEDLRDTLVIYAFETYEQEYLTLLGRQPGKRTVELNQLPPRGGVGGSDKGRGYVLDVDRRRFTHLAPHSIDVLMVHNGEKPGADIRSGLPQMKLCQCPQQRVLHKIICPVAGSRERPRIAAQPGNLLLDQTIKLRHSPNPLYPAIRGRWARTYSADVTP